MGLARECGLALAGHNGLRKTASGSAATLRDAFVAEMSCGHCCAADGPLAVASDVPETIAMCSTFILVSALPSEELLVTGSVCARLLGCPADMLRSFVDSNSGWSSTSGAKPFFEPSSEMGVPRRGGPKPLARSKVNGELAMRGLSLLVRKMVEYRGGSSTGGTGFLLGIVVAVSNAVAVEVMVEDA